MIVLALVAVEEHVFGSMMTAVLDGIPSASSLESKLCVVSRARSPRDRLTNDFDIYSA